MNSLQEQNLNAQVIQAAWDDPHFKTELIANPVVAMEKLTGHKLNLSENQKLVVVDQTDTSTVYFNLPARIDVNNIELSEEQLETVAGGSTPFCALGLGIMAGVAIWEAVH